MTGRREIESDPSNWESIRCGEAIVTFGKPYYGKRKIIANAPLSAESFDALIAALGEAKQRYTWEHNQ